MWRQVRAALEGVHRGEQILPLLLATSPLATPGCRHRPPRGERVQATAGLTKPAERGHGLGIRRWMCNRSAAHGVRRARAAHRALKPQERVRSGRLREAPCATRCNAEPRAAAAAAVRGRTQTWRVVANGIDRDRSNGGEPLRTAAVRHGGYASYSVHCAEAASRRGHGAKGPAGCGCGNGHCARQQQQRPSRPTLTRVRARTRRRPLSSGATPVRPVRARSPGRARAVAPGAGLRGTQRAAGNTSHPRAPFCATHGVHSAHRTHRACCRARAGLTARESARPR